MRALRFALVADRRAHARRAHTRTTTRPALRLGGEPDAFNGARRGPGAETCPDERELRAVLAARMGYDPVATDARRSVRIEVTRERQRFLARLLFRDGSGARRRSSAHPRQRLPQGARRSRCRSSSRSRDTPSIKPIAIAPSKRDERPSLRLGARGALGIGALPALTAALSIDVGVSWPYASLSLEGRMDVPMTGDVDEGRRLNASLFAGSLVPCGHYKWFVGCGLLMVGALRVEGRDIAHPNADTRAFVATGARLGHPALGPALHGRCARHALPVGRADQRA